MRNPVSLLDEYRLPLLDDKEAFAVLAFLLREGASTDDEISSVTKLSVAAIQSLKRRLFLGRFVRLRELDKISLTDRSAELLTRLGVAKVMIGSIMSHDLIASKSIAAGQEILMALVASDRVPLQKQLRFRVAQYLARALAQDAGEACRFLTASAVGMHEDTTNVPWQLMHLPTSEAGRETVARQGAGDLTMNQWHVPFHGAGDSTMSALHLALSDLDAAKAALDQNLILPNDEHQRRAVKFVILEGCASAMTQFDGPSAFLRFACHKDQSLPSRLWALWMGEHVDGMLRDTVDRFRPESFVVDFDLSKTSVPDVLGSILMAQSKATVPGRSWWERALFQSAPSVATFELALARIAELRRMIESGAFRGLAEAEQTRLQTEVRELAEVFSGHLAQTPPEGEGDDTKSMPEPLRQDEFQ